MAFLNRLTSSPSPLSTPQEAALGAAIALLTLDGDLIEVESRVVSLFRDQFPPLGDLDERAFQAAMEKAGRVITESGGVKDPKSFVATLIAPSITTPDQRLALYNYLYALAMADLNLDANESALLEAVKATFNLLSADVQSVEREVLAQFHSLHQSLAAIVLGLIVVSADGKPDITEIQNLNTGRVLLEPIGSLTDAQFDLVYALGLNIHDRFLLDVDNRKAFLTDILAQVLPDNTVRKQAFEFAAHVATSDGDIATPEMDVLKELLAAVNIGDADGEAIFNKYFARIKTIDGKPR